MFPLPFSTAYNLNLKRRPLSTVTTPRVTLHTVFASTAGRTGVGYADSHGKDSRDEGDGAVFRHQVSDVPRRLLDGPSGWLFDSERSVPSGPRL